MAPERARHGKRKTHSWLLDSPDSCRQNRVCAPHRVLRRASAETTERRAECSCGRAMLAGASPCFRSRTSPPFSLRELQGEGWHEEDRQAAAGAVARSGRTRPAWSGGTRRPVSDARCMSATAPLPRATDHRCDSCGYQISTSQPFPRCPMCGGHSWRLIAVTRQVLVRAGKPHREVAR